MDTWRQFSRAQPENFARRPNNLHSVFEYGIIHLIFSENSFSQKNSSGHVEGSFDNSTEEFLPEDPKKVPAHCLNMLKKFTTLSEKQNVFKIFSGHLECSFENSAEKILLEGWSFYTSL